MAFVDWCLLGVFIVSASSLSGQKRRESWRTGRSGLGFFFVRYKTLSSVGNTVCQTTSVLHFTTNFKDKVLKER